MAGYSDADMVKDIFSAATSQARRKYPTATLFDAPTQNSIPDQVVDYAKALMKDIPSRTEEGVGIHNAIYDALPSRFSPQFGPLEQNTENIGEMLRPSERDMNKYLSEHPGPALVGGIGASFLNPVGSFVTTLPFSIAGKAAKPVVKPIASYISKLMGR